MKGSYVGEVRTDRCEGLMKLIDYANNPPPDPGTTIGFRFYDKDGWTSGAVVAELKADGTVSDRTVMHNFPSSGEPVDSETITAVAEYAAERIGLCSGPGFVPGTQYVPAASTCPAWSSIIFRSLLKRMRG
jgi:hypothetical protein